MKPLFLSDLRDGFSLTWFIDGTDYPALWESFRGGLANCRLLNSHQDESTWKLEAAGRSFIMKSTGPDKGKSFLRALLAGPIYSRRQRLTWAARGRGCKIIPRIYLVAEKRDGFRRSAESFMLIEYIEGETLAEAKRGIPLEWVRGLEESLAALHSFGIASGNAHPGNLVKTAGGMKMIDISFKFPMLVSMANDIIDSGRKFGARVPVDRPEIKAAVPLVRFKRAWQKLRKDLKARRKKSKGQPAGQ